MAAAVVVVGVAVVLALGPAGCATSSSSGDALPPPPVEVEVVMTEYAFAHPPAVIPGRTVFRVRNEGTLAHEAILVALPDDVPPILEQLRSNERRAVSTLVTLRDRPPGSEGVFATDLAPGRYAFVCFVIDPDGVSHALKGMASEFRVA